MANNGKKLRATLAERYPKLSTSALRSLPSRGRILIKEEMHPDQRKIFSPYLLMRFDNILRKQDQERIVRCFDELNRIGLKYAHPEKNRSISPALHIALWEIFGSIPYITRDTRLQSQAAQPILQRLLTILKVELAPKLSRLLQQFCPEQWARMKKFVTLV